jgi:NAD(P)-dependent dehydrogenase (short-subunit alcohol dehydrogenase family)
MEDCQDHSPHHHPGRRRDGQHWARTDPSHVQLVQVRRRTCRRPLTIGTTEGLKLAQRTWLITGDSSGFGRELSEQLLERGERVVGTVRDTSKETDLLERYPQTFRAEMLDVTDTLAIHGVVDRSFAQHGRIDVIVNNAGYGLFGAAEELSDEQVDRIVATNLVGSIQVIRSALPHLRAQGGGRVLQISSYGGQVAFPGNSMYHATKWGIEGFVESVAQEVAAFGIGVTIVEPGGARTEFRYGSAQVADLMPAYEDIPAHGFLRMLDPVNGLAPGDPARMAARIIESVDVDPAPLRMVLGSQALETAIATLQKRIADFEAQTEIAASNGLPSRGVRQRPVRRPLILDRADHVRG